MSEYSPTEKTGSEHLASRPLTSSPVTPTSTLRGPHFATEAPRVLARMPDLGTAETEREAQLPSLARDGRLLSSRVSVAVLMGGVAVLLLIALVPFAFFGKDKKKAADDASAWQQPPAPNAPMAPAWPDAKQDSLANAPAAPAAVTGPAAPAANWNAEVASQPATTPSATPPAWRTDSQSSAPSPWGATADSSQQGAWNQTAPAPNTMDANYNWGNPSQTVAATAQDPWNSQNQTPAWQNNNQNQAPAWQNNGQVPPYGTNPQSQAAAPAAPASDPWSSATQPPSAETQAAYTGQPSASRPVGPMMPSAPAGLSSGGYEASRSMSPYRNQYPAQTDTAGTYGQGDPNAYRLEAANPQQAPAAQPYANDYNSQPYYPQQVPSAPRNDRGADGQPAAGAPYGYNTAGTTAAPYGTNTAAMNYNNVPSYPSNNNYNNNSYQPSYQAGYPQNQPSQQASYPAVPPNAYPTADGVQGTAAQTSYTTGASRPEPGVARFQGGIERPNGSRTTYDSTRPSLY